ncbi:hypothetical protein KM043_003189 [Ampulex compressa]|nr:hypothetical protein KM043_003189 [Ampulex compressa]
MSFFVPWKDCLALCAQGKLTVPSSSLSSRRGKQNSARPIESPIEEKPRRALRGKTFHNCAIFSRWCLERSARLRNATVILISILVSRTSGSRTIERILWTHPRRTPYPIHRYVYLALELRVSRGLDETRTLFALCETLWAILLTRTQECVPRRTSHNLWIFRMHPQGDQRGFFEDLSSFSSFLTFEQGIRMHLERKPAPFHASYEISSPGSSLKLLSILEQNSLPDSDAVLELLRCFRRILEDPG